MPGNPEEFLLLLKPHYQDALKYCHALCRDHHEAQDLLQQSLVQALEKAPGLREQEKFKSWYFKIITRAFYTQKRKSFWQRFLPMASSEAGPAFPAFYEEAAEEGRKNHLLLALQELTSKERAAILLFEIGDFSIQEIADIQEEKSLSAIKSRLSRTRQKLKANILALEKKTDHTLIPTTDLNHETEQLATAFTNRR